MKLPIASFAAMATLAALLVIPSGASALIQNFDVKAAKKGGGPYKDGPASATVEQGKTKLLFWRVESVSASDRTVRFDDAATGDSGGGDYNVKWFKGRKANPAKDVSHDVQTAGYEFTLKAKKRKFFTAKIKPKPGAGTLCIGGQAQDDPITTSDASYFNVNGLCS